MLTVSAQPRLAQFVPITNEGPAAPECLDAIREGDPAVAQVLYASYAGQIRSYLRRHTGIHDVEGAVFSILVEAIRSIRERESPTFEDLSQTVQDLSQQGAFALRGSCKRERFLRPGLMAFDTDRDRINSLFTVLDLHEREILLRSYLLTEKDDEISRRLEIPVLQIQRIRAKARTLFRISCEAGTQDARAARA